MHPRTPDEIESGQTSARVISDEIADGAFDYLHWFPNGNKAYLFQRALAPFVSALGLIASPSEK